MSPMVDGDPVESAGTKPSMRQKELEPKKKPYMELYSGCWHKSMTDERLLTKGRPKVSVVYVVSSVFLLVSSGQNFVSISQTGRLYILVRLN